jgi:hypothetical protein
MDNFRVVGESREVGAIGIFEPFRVIVTTESSHEAYDKVRDQLYASNRDHVLVKAVYRLTDDGEELVEPRAYL